MPIMTEITDARINELISSQTDLNKCPANDFHKIGLRQYTLEELKDNNGCQGDDDKDGVILLALNGNVYDVTSGSKFYGPDGPYSVFAGTDATLGLATFNLGDVKRRKKLHLEERHFANIAHWEKTFAGKYPIVGTLAPAPLGEDALWEKDHVSLKTINKYRQVPETSSDSKTQTKTCEPCNQKRSRLCTVL